MADSIAEDSPATLLTGTGFNIAATDLEGEVVDVQVFSNKQAMVANASILIDLTKLLDIQITITPEPDVFGPVALSIIAVDDGSNVSNPALVDLFITPVNDKPTFSLDPEAAFLTDFGGLKMISNFATDFNPGPNEFAQTITGFQVTKNSDPNGIASDAAIDANGVLSAELSGLSGQAQFTARATDSAGASSASVAFGITVRNHVSQSRVCQLTHAAIADGQGTFLTMPRDNAAMELLLPDSIIARCTSI